MNIRKISSAVVFALLAFVGLQACTSGPEEEGALESEVALPPPTNLVVSNVRPDRQDLTWTAVPDTVKHVIYRSTTGPANLRPYTECCLGQTNTFIATNLTGGVEYCWAVANVNSLGERSTLSNAVCLTTPTTVVVPPPTGVTATAISSSRIRVSWTAVSGAVRYYINRSTTSGGPYSRIATVSGSATSYENVGLATNTTYYYTVQVETIQGISGHSVEVSATTAALGIEGHWKFDERTGTTAQDSSPFNRDGELATGAAFSTTNRAPLHDNKSSVAIGDASTANVAMAYQAGFNMQNSFSITAWVNLPSTLTSTRLMGMRAAACGTLGWEFRHDSGNFVFQSGVSTATFASGIAANEWTHVAVTFSNSSPTAAGTMVLYVDGAQVGTASYTPSALPAALPLQVGHPGECVGSGFTLDELAIFSRMLSASEIATVGTTPPAPTNLRITNTTSTVMDLAWDPVPNAERHQIWRNGVFYTNAPATPSFKADHLQPDTSYTWQVKAIVNNVVSDFSNSITGSTTAGPAAPTGVTAVALSSTRIRVSWSAVASATKYYVRMSTDGVTYSPRGSVLAPGTTLDVVNLTPNTTYYFVVRAEDAGLTQSPDSAPASATTLP